MPVITLAEGDSLFVALAVFAGAALAVTWLYVRVYRTVGRHDWRILLGLRLAAVATVTLLWFRPVFSFERVVRRPPVLALLVDVSASMSVADSPQGETRIEQARRCGRELAGELGRDFRLSIGSFSSGAAAVAGPDPWSGLDATGAATSISRALAAVAGLAPQGPLEGAVLLTDGLHNSAGDPVQAARELGVPVYPIGVGNSLRGSTYSDLHMAGLECPENLPVQNRAVLTAHIEATGLAGQVVQVLLEEDDQQVGQQELVIDNVPGAQGVAFEHVPTRKGLRRYTVRVSPLAGERIEQNNSRSASALVVDQRIRVLYLEGTLRPEYGVLSGRLLARDPDVEFCALVQTRPGKFTARSNLEEGPLDRIPDDAQAFARFDVFLIGDLDSSAFRPEQLQLLRQRVEQGAGLMMIGGYHSLGPGGYADTPLADLLPVELGARDIGQVTEPFLPRLTPDGRGHAIFANIAHFFGDTGAPGDALLPPLAGCVRVGPARPAATVLARHPTALDESQAAMPVLAIQPFLKGRAAVFTADTTWNWYQSLRALDRESPYLRFWGQAVRWLAGRPDAVEAGPMLRVTTDKAFCEPESSIRLSAVVRGPTGEAAGEAEVTAVVSGPRGWRQSLPLPAIPGPAGNFGTAIEPQHGGRYEILVTARLGEQELTSAPVFVDVGRPNLEFDRIDFDDRLLKTIAAESGGQYFHVSEADRLVPFLSRRQREERVQVEVPLAWPPLFWGLLVGLLSMEWILRRRRQLR